MKYIVPILLSTAMMANANASSSKQACETLKPVVAELQSQAPIDVDYMTKLTGVQSLFVSGVCLLNYSYVLDTQALLKDMAVENELSNEENLQFLKTEEGNAVMQEVFAENAKSASAMFEPFAEIKGMKITYTYAFDETGISQIVTTVLNNEI